MEGAKNCIGVYFQFNDSPSLKNDVIIEKNYSGLIGGFTLTVMVFVVCIFASGGILQFTK